MADFNQQYYGGQYGYPFSNNGVWNGQQSPQQGPAVNVPTWLTKEEIDALRPDTKFNIGVSEEELRKAMCNHRDQNGAPALKVNDVDGSVTCMICGETFTYHTDLANDDVKSATKVIKDILQSIKVLYFDLPATAGRDYFRVIGFIDKLPKLYEIACNDYKKYMNTNAFTNQIPQNPLSLFASMTNPGFGVPYAYGSFNNPYMQQPYGAQPYPAGQPSMAPTYGQPAMSPMGNPFYQQQPGQYGYPQQAVVNQPQQTFSLNPQGAAAPQPSTVPGSVNNFQQPAGAAPFYGQTAQPQPQYYQQPAAPQAPAKPATPAAPVAQPASSAVPAKPAVTGNFKA